MFPYVLVFYFDEIEGVSRYTTWDPQNGKKCSSILTSCHKYFRKTPTGPYAREYNIVMHKEIVQIINKSTWCMIPPNNLPKLPNVKSPMLSGRCNFKPNQMPNGYLLKFKAWYCVLLGW